MQAGFILKTYEPYEVNFIKLFLSLCTFKRFASGKCFASLNKGANYIIHFLYLKKHFSASSYNVSGFESEVHCTVF